jgi:hypothetical protein
MTVRTACAGALALSVLLIGCSGSSASPAATTTPAEPATTGPATTDALPSTTGPTTTGVGSAAGAPVTFTAQVWADNWFSLYVNGKKVGEDSVPITTVRSFNAETISFTASYPLTIALVSKDYVEGDSGLEYIGTARQQMGDGGFIAQFTDTATGNVIATTNSAWRGLVIFRAPLNSDCVTSTEPATTCTHQILPEPDGWTSPSFDDTSWVAAREYTAAEVGPKDGYDTVAWAPDATLIWSDDLKVDNTILWRTTVTQP